MTARRTDRRLVAASLLMMLSCALAARAAGTGAPAEVREPIEPLPLTVPGNPRRVALGAALFADVRLSHDGKISCASCHPLQRGGMDGLRRARAADGKTLLRNTPTIFNVGFDLFFNWDGTSEQLPLHDERVLRNPALMNTSWEELLPRLESDARYARDFAAAYPGGITRASVLDAIASFEISLITPNSRFDSFLRGNKAALAPAEQDGYVLFRSIGCTACHQGRNIGGNLLQKFGIFHDTSVGRDAGEPVDLGYFKATQNPFDREVFRVPSLRNVAVTAPYFHDGRAPTLQVAVATMARVQLGRSITPEQIALIVGFLRTLTGQYQGRYLDADPLPAPAPP